MLGDDQKDNIVVIGCLIAFVIFIFLI